MIIAARIKEKRVVVSHLRIVYVHFKLWGILLTYYVVISLRLGWYTYQMNYDPRKQTNASPTPQKTVAIDVRDAG